MKNIDKMINESLSKSLKKLIKESQVNSFENGLSELDNKFNAYIMNERNKLSNKEEYYSTIKDLLIKYNDTILKLGYTYSNIESQFLYSSVIEVKYFINGSYNWSDDEILDADDNLYETFDFNELRELGIDISLKDMSKKGGESFILLSFDMDNIFDFDFSEK